MSEGGKYIRSFTLLLLATSLHLNLSERVCEDAQIFLNWLGQRGYLKAPNRNKSHFKFSHSVQTHIFHIQMFKPCSISSIYILMVLKKSKREFSAVIFVALYGSKASLFSDKVLSAQLCVWKKVRNLVLIWIISLWADIPVQTADRVGTIATHPQTPVNKTESLKILRLPCWRGR